MINAKAETLQQKPSFKSSFGHRRCLVVADGFYEWRHEEKEKIPFFIRLKGHGLFGFAGLYDEWVSPEGKVIKSCTIITTDSNDLIRPIHDRMPVIVTKESEATWLDPSNREMDRFKEILKAYPSDEMESYQVSQVVNSPANNLPECMEPL